MKTLSFILLLLLVCLGCGPSKSPQQSLQYWELQANSDQPEGRAAAAKALGEIGPKGVPALLQLSQDRNGHVRAVSNLALLTIGKKAEPQLFVALNDPDPKIRIAAIKSLQSLGPDTKETIPAMKEMLRDKNPGVRRAAASSLLLLGEKRPKKKNTSSWLAK
jgi:HEAT repeat protein